MEAPKQIGPILDDPSGGQIARERIAQIRELLEGDVALRNIDDPRKWGRELAAQQEVEAILDHVELADYSTPDIVVPPVNFTHRARSV